MMSPERVAGSTQVSKPETTGQDDSTLNTTGPDDSTLNLSSESIEEPSTATGNSAEPMVEPVDVSSLENGEELKLYTGETLPVQSDSAEVPILEAGESGEGLTKSDNELSQPEVRDPSATFAVATRSILRRLEDSYRNSSPSLASKSQKPATPLTVPLDSSEVVEVPLGNSEGASSATAGDTASKMPPVMLRMPNTAFGIAMGLAGNAIMWRSAGISPFIADRIDAETANNVFWSAGVIAGAMVAVAYVYKAFSTFELVKQEYRHPSRVHFMNGPHLALIMLTISVPEDVGVSDASLRIIWSVGFAFQIIITQFIYEVCYNEFIFHFCV